MSSIGILTFQWPKNIGALLQAYSLKKIITSLGYDVEIMNFHHYNHALIVESTIRPDKLARKYKLLRYRCSLEMTAKMIAFDINNVLFSYISSDNIRRINNFELFRRLHLHIKDEKIRNLDELKSSCSRYRAIIVGSDQVWHPDALEYSDYAYLLPFKLKHAKKIAFSTSIAVDLSLVPSNMLNLFKKLLKDFSFVSLREYYHAKALSRILDMKIHHTLDPTLLVDRQVLEELAANSSSSNAICDEYVLLYNLSTDILPYTKKIEETLKLPVMIYRKPTTLVEIMRYSKYVRNRLTFYWAGPCDFLALLKRARLIITNSYHGVALSILFAKPFFAIASNAIAKTRVRIMDLLKLLNLGNRLILSINDFSKLVHEDIDYNGVHAKLCFFRTNSLRLLREALKSI